jgi:uncharacterized membrane protein
MSSPPPKPVWKSSLHPFRAAVLRGLGVLVPPLLTVVILVWVVNTTRQYVLEPVNTGAREAIVWLLSGEIREELPLVDATKRTTVDGTGRPYYRLDDGTFVPLTVYDRVRRGLGDEPIPQTGKGVYQRYVELTYLRPYYAIPFFLAVFTLLVYLMGKLMAVGIGGFLGDGLERAIHRLPLIRSVYAAVKQVSDFFLQEKPSQFTRVVAVEYPRLGMWSIAFVTSDGLSAVRAAANEPVLGIFVPTSPMPMTGYALTVLRREIIDLNITVDQAIQFCVSCGLVIPPQDLPRLIAGEPPDAATEASPPSETSDVPVSAAGGDATQAGNPEGTPPQGEFEAREETG